MFWVVARVFPVAVRIFKSVYLQFVLNLNLSLVFQFRYDRQTQCDVHLIILSGHCCGAVEVKMVCCSAGVAEVLKYSVVYGLLRSLKP